MKPGREGLSRNSDRKRNRYEECKRVPHPVWVEGDGPAPRAWQLRTAQDRYDEKHALERQAKAQAAGERAQSKVNAAAQKQQLRADAYSEAQKTCPIPIDPKPQPLPGGLSVFNDEFVLATARDWGLSSQRLILTTHRLIHSHGRLTEDQQVVYLTDIRDVAFKKPLMGYGTLTIETAGEHSLEGLPTVKNGQAMRDKLLALVHWARQRAQQPAVAPVAASAPPADKYDQLRKLAELKTSGVLTEAEFEVEKAKLLA